MLGYYPLSSSPISSAPSGGVPSPSPGPRYWIATSSGVWSDHNNWSTTSGGVGGASVPCGGINDVYLDANGLGNCIMDMDAVVLSLTVSSTNVLDMATHDLDVTGLDLSSTCTMYGGTGKLTVRDYWTKPVGTTWIRQTVTCVFIDCDLSLAQTTTFNKVDIYGDCQLLTGSMFMSGGDFTINVGATMYQVGSIATYTSVYIYGDLTASSTTAPFYTDLTSAEEMVVADGVTFSPGEFFFRITNPASLRPGTFKPTTLSFWAYSSIDRSWTPDAGTYIFDCDVRFNATDGRTFEIDMSVNDPTIQITGDFTDISVASNPVIINGGKFEFTGTGTQDAVLDGIAIDLPIGIDKSSGTLSLQAGSYILGEDSTVYNLILESGTNFDMNDYDLTVTNYMDCLTGSSVDMGNGTLTLDDATLDNVVDITWTRQNSTLLISGDSTVITHYNNFFSNVTVPLGTSLTIDAATNSRMMVAGECHVYGTVYNYDPMAIYNLGTLHIHSTGVFDDGDSGSYVYLYYLAGGGGLTLFETGAQINSDLLIYRPALGAVFVPCDINGTIRFFDTTNIHVIELQSGSYSCTRFEMVVGTGELSWILPSNCIFTINGGWYMQNDDGRLDVWNGVDSEINLYGDMTQGGIGGDSTWYDSGGVFQWLGNGDQDINVGTTETVSHVVLNKSAGTATLTANIYCAGATFTDGNLDLNAFDFVGTGYTGVVDGDVVIWHLDADQMFFTTLTIEEGASLTSRTIVTTHSLRILAEVHNYGTMTLGSYVYVMYYTHHIYETGVVDMYSASGLLMHYWSNLYQNGTYIKNEGSIRAAFVYIYLPENLDVWLGDIDVSGSGNLLVYCYGGTNWSADFHGDANVTGQMRLGTLQDGMLDIDFSDMNLIQDSRTGYLNLYSLDVGGDVQVTLGGTIQTNARMIVTGDGDVTITQGNGTITLAGTAGSQRIEWPLLDNLIVDNASSEVTFADGVTAQSFSAIDGDLIWEGEFTSEGDFSIDGATVKHIAADAMNGCIINVEGDFNLQGRSDAWIVFAATDTWYLNVDGTVTPVRYVETAYSDASGTNGVVPYSKSMILIDQTDWSLNIDNGNNINWGFPPDSTDGDQDIDLNVVVDPTLIELNRRTELDIDLNVAVDPKEITLG
jgi:hypothetical protein